MRPYQAYLAVVTWPPGTEDRICPTVVIHGRVLAFVTGVFCAVAAENETIDLVDLCSRNEGMILRGTAVRASLFKQCCICYIVKV